MFMRVCVRVCVRVQWEALLPTEIRQHVVPKRNPTDPSSTASSGPFKGFPHYSTSELKLSKEQTNLLADFTGWVIRANQAEFEAALAA